VVRTNHCSLEYLWDQIIVTEAQQKWLIKLVGTVKPMADALSSQMDDALIAIAQPLPRWVDPIRDEVMADTDLQGLVTKIKEDEVVIQEKIDISVLLFMHMCFSYHFQ